MLCMLCRWVRERRWYVLCLQWHVYINQPSSSLMRLILYYHSEVTPSTSLLDESKRSSLYSWYLLYLCFIAPSLSAVL